MLYNSKVSLFCWLVASLACNHSFADVEVSKTDSKTSVAVPKTENVLRQKTSNLTAPDIGMAVTQPRQFSNPVTPPTPRLSSSNLQASVATNSSSPLFEDSKQQRKYESVLNGIRNLKLNDGNEGTSNDWFVVGGVVGNQANFDAFQGEEDVARRVVEFLEQTDNRCQWKIFSRETDAYTAQENVSKVQSEYQQWRQAQINRQNAIRRSQQQAAANAYRRRCSSGSG
ncbi:MAG: hypothetical protein P8R31_06560 [Mariniblastus sp.]|nr:hypothetical protein [Mariniblastus sp.]